MAVRSPDVVVIGGGIVGTSAAAFLAEAGARVLLVEREQIGAGASGRNSGVIQHPFDPVLADLHLETLRLYRELGDESTSGSAPFVLPVKPAGLLLVSPDVEGTERLARDATAGVPHLRPLFLTPADLQRLEPALAPDLAACRLDIGYPVEPGAATRAYAALGRRRGVQVATGSAAAISLGGDRANGVAIGDRVVAANAVVVAAGAWSARVVDPSGRWSPIAPNWGVVVEVELADPPGHVLEEAEIDAAIEPAADGAGVELTAVAFSLVTARTSSGARRSSLGSTFLDEQPDPGAYAPMILERGSRFVPGVVRAPVSGLRACARPTSRDGRPLIGHVPGLRGAFIAAGHGPWGISTGPAAGRMIADLVLGREPRIASALDPARFGSP